MGEFSIVMSNGCHEIFVDCLSWFGSCHHTQDGVCVCTGHGVIFCVYTTDLYVVMWVARGVQFWEVILY